MAPITGLVKRVGGSDTNLESPRAFQRYVLDCLHRQAGLAMEVEVTLNELALKRSGAPKVKHIVAAGPGEVRYDDKLLPVALFLSDQDEQFITIIVASAEVRVTYESVH